MPKRKMDYSVIGFGWEREDCGEENKGEQPPGMAVVSKDNRWKRETKEAKSHRHERERERD